MRGEIETAKYPPPSAQRTSTAPMRSLRRNFGRPKNSRSAARPVGSLKRPCAGCCSSSSIFRDSSIFDFGPRRRLIQKQIEAYYNDQFVPQLKARNQPVPPLDDVEDTIREVLIQQAINDRATQWLEDTRSRLKIDVVPHGAKP